MSASSPEVAMAGARFEVTLTDEERETAAQRPALFGNHR
jgi:hypothetical protein